MNNVKSMPSDQDVDQLLTEFFQSEMPATFPALRLPRSTPLPRASRWKQASTRFALAAAVLVCLVGYLALAGSFKPRDEAGLNGPEIGQLEKSKSARPR
jgi:hypothetical protein